MTIDQLLIQVLVDHHFYGTHTRLGSVILGPNIVRVITTSTGFCILALENVTLLQLPQMASDNQHCEQICS